jgi:magnesium and cobalt transporter
LEEGSESKFWNAIGRFFRNKSDLSMEELIQAAREDGEIKPEDALMLLNIVRLERKQVGDIMIPRPDIVCADLEDGLEDICAVFIKHGHSRIPVYQDNRDHIKGVIYAKDLLAPFLLPDAPRPTLRELMRTPLFISETKNLKEMLFEFQNQRKHIAIALDEYGGTSGLVTLEDVLEEIVGEIEDEYDPHRPEDVLDLGEGRYQVAGRIPLSELCDELGIELTSEQVETLGGYLSELAGRVPRQGEFFTLEGRRFTIKEASKRRIRWILIEPSQI